MASAAALTVQLQGMVTEQNRNLTAVMGSANNAITSMSGSVNRLARAIDSTKIDATLENVRKTTENTTRLIADLDSSNAQLRGLLAKAQNGNGTIGKLLSDSLLYTDIRHTVATMDSLLADIKANPKKYINLRIF
jgi:phospholipid/cholesterol/gamma-HCH transport system substrate-binding protein